MHASHNRHITASRVDGFDGSVQGDAHEYSGSRARKIGDLLTGILNRLPDVLQEDPLLGIYHLRFSWRDPKEHRVELVDLFHLPAPLAVPLVHLLEGLPVV